MRKLIAIAAVALCAASANAQVSFWDANTPEKTINIGPRVGLNISSITGDIEDVKSKVGFNIGAAVEFNLIKSFGINTGLFYTTKGTKTKGVDITANAGFLEIPVMASYRLNFTEDTQLQVNFGPYFAYGINGKTTVKEDGDKRKYDTFGDDGLGLKRFDCGLGVGTSLAISKFVFGVNYQFGLTNLSDDDDASVKNSNVSISVGYNF